MGLVTNDVVLCKAFPSMLTDKVLTWFTSWKSRTIHYTREMFLDKFSTAGTIPKTRGDLANIKQREDESLLYFLEHFKKTYDEIERISQNIVIIYFEGEFRSRMLYIE